MRYLLVLLLMTAHPHRIQGLFKVTVPKTTYTVRYGETVLMTCNFPFEKDEDINKLMVSWQHLQDGNDAVIQVVQFKNGKEDWLNQESTYRGRASLLYDELIKGEATLEIKDVKLTDAGTYRCLVQLGGADYNKIKLEVQASYSDIQQSIQVSHTDNEIYVTCHSLGFPKAEVFWQINGINVSSTANTSHTRTVAGFYNTTSILRITDTNKSYNCVFWNNALRERTEALVQYSDTGTDGFSFKMKVIIPFVVVLVLLCTVATISYSRKRLCFKFFRKKGDCPGPL
ncbi:programmed cell death 1 ligand 2-like [Hyperolius riggenbachi]|uniref:programmed cell death 1 ligand 2-like n=1 Tax=Hyperolius riggenbachi TaxID=752182 RepID=UPI0035A27354